MSSPSCLCFLTCLDIFYSCSDACPYHVLLHLISLFPFFATGKNCYLIQPPSWFHSEFTRYCLHLAALPEVMVLILVGYQVPSLPRGLLLLVTASCSFLCVLALLPHNFESFFIGYFAKLTQPCQFPIQLLWVQRNRLLKLSYVWSNGLPRTPPPVLPLPPVTCTNYLVFVY